MFLLHLTFTSGFSRTLTFASRFARGLMMITLADQPIVLRTEDRS